MASLKEQLAQIPDATGVYLLRDKDRKIIYIGKAISLRKRLLSHARSHLASKISKIDFIRASSELDALILEAKLIKKHRPRYNISLRDDKQYPYIKLTDETFPRVLLVRETLSDKGKYFGPFMGGSARNLIALASRVFGIRRCRQTPLRKRKQPCLDYHIKRCAGPCAAKVSKKEYASRVLEFSELLKNGLTKAIEKMNRQMEKAAKKLDFEAAAELRNRISWLLRAESGSYSGSRYFVSSPKEKRTALLELKEALGLERAPQRIEAFDISNLGGSKISASMVVFKEGLPYKSHYRRFKISSRGVADDILSMNEVVFRRYSGSLSRMLPLPDLILIDGGRGQLSSALKALKEAKADIPAIGLAKRFEEIYVKGLADPIALPKDSAGLRLLQNIRDEAHRFAVKYHRLRRKKGLADQAFDNPL